jgi:hypothetical protein
VPHTICLTPLTSVFEPTIIPSVHRIGVSCLSDPHNLAVLDPDVCLEDARPVDDEGVGDDQVEYFGIGPVGRLTLSVSQGFA